MTYIYLLNKLMFKVKKMSKKRKIYGNTEKVGNYFQLVKEELEAGLGGAIKLGTARNYAQFIDPYLSYAGIENVQKLKDEEKTSAISKSIDDWLLIVPETTWGRKTKAVAAIAVLSFYNVMYHIKIPYKQVKHARRVLSESVFFAPKLFTYDEAYTILRNGAMAGHEKYGFSDAIIIGWNTIARRLELAQLRIEDDSGKPLIDPEQKFITIEGVKGSGDHTFTPKDPLTPDFWGAVKRRYEFAIQKRSNYLFPCGRNDHLEAPTLTYWFSQYRKLLFGEERKGSIHDYMRHTKVTMLLDRGHPIDRVQELARHKFRTTTQKYDHRSILDRLGGPSNPDTVKLLGLARE